MQISSMSAIYYNLEIHPNLKQQSDVYDMPISNIHYRLPIADGNQLYLLNKHFT